VSRLLTGPFSGLGFRVYHLDEVAVPAVDPLESWRERSPPQGVGSTHVIPAIDDAGGFSGGLEGNQIPGLGFRV